MMMQLRNSRVVRVALSLALVLAFTPYAFADEQEKQDKAAAPVTEDLAQLVDVEAKKVTLDTRTSMVER